MPAFTSVLIKTPGNTGLDFVTLNGTDTFTADQINNQSLILKNPTASPIAITMIGDDAPATFRCGEIGVVTVAAEAVTVPANDAVSVYLSDLRVKLKGVTTITGGTGLEALLVTY